MFPLTEIFQGHVCHCDIGRAETHICLAIQAVTPVDRFVRRHIKLDRGGIVIAPIPGRDDGDDRQLGVHPDSSYLAHIPVASQVLTPHPEGVIAI